MYSVEELVQLRSSHRSKYEFKEADQIKEHLLFEHGITLEDSIHNNFSTTIWKPATDTDIITATATLSKKVVSKNKVNPFEFAKAAFDKAENPGRENSEAVERLAIETLRSIDRADLHGRRYADLALLFALAGTRNRVLFDRLASMFRDYLLTQKDTELLHARWVRHSLERFRSAGVPSSHSLFTRTHHLFPDSSQRQQDESFVFSARSLIWLSRQVRRWQKSGRQRLRQCISKEIDFSNTNISTLFSDPSLPLVIDIGCGLGVSLLGMTSLSYSQSFNRLGCDLSTRSVRFAAAFAERWNISTHCAFVEAEALALLTDVQKNYPGRVAWISINFPSPYSITELINVSQSVGNKQLPNLESFMVSDALVEKSIELLQKSHSHNRFLTNCLYFQTNVEDVGITVQDMINRAVSTDPNTYFPCQDTVANCFLTSVTNISTIIHNEADRCGYTADTPLWSDFSPEFSDSSLVKRQRVWISSGSATRRACGPGWLSEGVLPICSQTETEVSCNEECKPIYRLIYRFS